MHTLIEKTRVKQKNHRCTGAQEYSFTSRDVVSDHTGDKSEDNLCHLCLIHGLGKVIVYRIT